MVGKQHSAGLMDSYETQIDISTLPSGFYLLKSTDEDGNSYVGRFLVKE
jgi:hypothetical protein